MIANLRERARELKELASQLDRIACELETTGTNESNLIQFEAPPSASRTENVHASLDWAEKHYLARRQRDRFFDADLFAEPAWDILLDLFISGSLGRSVSVTSACIASGSPSTTALRWLRLLETRGLIDRRPSLKDRRTFWLSLSERGHRKMTAFLQQVAYSSDAARENLPT